MWSLQCNAEFGCQISICFGIKKTKENLDRISFVVEVEVKLRPTVSRPVCFAVGLPSGTYDVMFVSCLTITDFLMWSILSDERMELKFIRIIDFGPCQSSHSPVQVQQK
jgi:hypothetical protein